MPYGRWCAVDGFIRRDKDGLGRRRWRKAVEHSEVADILAGEENNDGRWSVRRKYLDDVLHALREGDGRATRSRHAEDDAPTCSSDWWLGPTCQWEKRGREVGC